MSRKGIISFFAGFLVLFFVYHFPEFYAAFWIMAIFKIGFLVVAFLLARLQGWKGLGGYGLGLAKGWAANLIKGLLVGLFFFSLSVFVSILSGYQAILEVSSFKDVVVKLPMILLMTAVPSIAEDILTRGYLFAHLKFIKNGWWILLSASVYVLNHIWRLQDGPAVLSYLFVFGLLLALAVSITRSLWLAFGIHWGANIAFESCNSIIKTNTLVQHDGPNWLLAVTWALLLTLLLVFNWRKNNESSFLKSD